MKETDNIDECTDPMQSVTIELPCALVERVNNLARDEDTTLSIILIEALDTFLRNRVQRTD